LPQIQPRMEVLSDIGQLAGFMVTGLPAIRAEGFAATGHDEATCRTILQFALWRLDGLSDWHRDRVFTELKAVAEAMPLKIKSFLLPVFVAVTGTTSSFSVVDAMALRGSDMSRARLRHGIAVLGGLSGKQQKVLEKAYRALWETPAEPS